MINPDPYITITGTTYRFLADCAGQTNCTQSVTPIQSAINYFTQNSASIAASDRAIFVDGGTYRENVLISGVRDLAVRGSANGARSVIDGSVTIANSVGINLSAFNVNAGISVSKSQNVSVSNVATNQVTISQSQNVTLSNSLVTTNNKSKPALKIEESDKVYVQQVNLDSFIRVDNSANVSIVGTNANDQLLITNDNVLSLNVDTRAGNDALTLVGDVAALNVNADGDLILTRATRVASPSGNVTLRAGGALTLEAGSVIDASAMNTGNGGTVTINSAGTKFYGNIFSRGGENGGNGGFVEVSGKYLLFEGNVDTRAPRGIAGNLLIDPDYVTVDSATTDDT